MTRTAAALSMLLITAGPVLAQGNDAQTSAAGAGASQHGRAVAIGAGSTAAVTTGSSGPQDPATPAMAALPAPFSIVPPRGDFFGPGSLPIRVPERLRCDVVGEKAAKALCEARAAGRGRTTAPTTPTGASAP